MKKSTTTREDNGRFRALDLNTETIIELASVTGRSPASVLEGLGELADAAMFLVEDQRLLIPADSKTFDFLLAHSNRTIEPEAVFQIHTVLDRKPVLQ